jgi:lipid-binding SYLF domain-containing protein
MFTLGEARIVAAPRENKTVEAAVRTLQALAENPLRNPFNLLHDAQGVAIIPGVVRGGLLLDGRFGRGVLLARRPDGAWAHPVFLTLEGTGLGLQAGIESTDVILVFRTPGSLERILRGNGKLRLGSDVAVAAGLIGGEAETTAALRRKAEVYCYSRSRGLFAGLSLEGDRLLVDQKANEAFYGLRGCKAGDVLALRQDVAAAGSLRALLARLCPPTVAVPAEPPVRGARPHRPISIVPGP